MNATGSWRTGPDDAVAERIPDADLSKVDAAHLYPTDDPSADLRIGAFLSGAHRGVSQRRLGRAPTLMKAS